MANYSQRPPVQHFLRFGCDDPMAVMEVHRSKDTFRLREIERQLTAELQRARERVRLATTKTELRTASESLDVTLKRM
jgi:hypothetical protein